MSPRPGVRATRTSLRIAHLLAVASLYGGHVFDVSAERLEPALMAVLLSGAAFAGFEIWRAPVWIVQVRGLATGLKAALVGSVALCWDHRVLILSVVMAMGAVISHMPGRYRYYSPWHGRVIHHGSGADKG